MAVLVPCRRLLLVIGNKGGPSCPVTSHRQSPTGRCHTHPLTHAKKLGLGLAVELAGGPLQTVSSGCCTR
jgi:hypothetical protein